SEHLQPGNQSQDVLRCPAHRLLCNRLCLGEKGLIAHLRAIRQQLGPYQAVFPLHVPLQKSRHPASLPMRYCILCSMMKMSTRTTDDRRPTTVATIDKSAIHDPQSAIDALAGRVQACRLCPRMEGRTRVFGRANGDTTAPLLFVAAAPGRLGAG